MTFSSQNLSMKSKKSSKFLLKYIWVFIILGLSLLATLFFKSNTYNLVELKKINQGLMHIIKLDTSVDEHAIKNLIGVEYDYDLLSQSINEFEIFNEQFFYQLHPESQSLLYKQWTTYKQKSRIKLDNIESFKSALAILKNSVTYFIRLMTEFELKMKENPDVLSIIVDLEHKILLFYFNESVTELDEINQLLKKLSHRKDVESERGSYHELISRHTIIILQQKNKVNTLLNKILDGQLQKQLHLINKVFVRNHEKLINQATTYRNLLFFIVIVLSLIIYFTITKVLSTSRQLKHSLRDLNYRQIAEDEHSIVSIADVKGVITFVNDKFIEVSKYSRKELIGKKHNIIKSDYHEDAYFKSMWRTIAQGKTWHGIVKNRAKDGTHYWVESTIVPFLDDNGKPFQYISMRTDITEQLLIKEQLADSNIFMNSLTNAMGEGVFAIDKDLKCTYFNDKAEELLLWSKNEVLGCSLDIFFELVESESKDENNNNLVIQHCLEKGEIQRSEKYQVITKDKSIFASSIVASPLYEKNDIVGIVVVFSDITLRKQMQLKLSEAKDRAEEANKMKSDFIANMSHELRTPLNAIIGLNHLVLQTQLDKTQLNYLTKVEVSSKVLLGLINDVLDMSKIEAGKLCIESVQFSLEEQFNQLYDVLVDKAKDSELEIYFSFDIDIPNQIISDPLRISQVLMNLVSNAIKFTEKGGITIKVSIKEIDRSSHQLVLFFEVIDTGIGITDEQQKKLFDAFTQADTSTSRKYGGTGLGLNISKNLVNLMGGHIGVNSKKNRGSTFYFDIKCTYEDNTIPSLLHKLTLGKHALLLDGETITYDILKKMLSSFNFELYSIIGSDLENQGDNFNSDLLSEDLSIVLEQYLHSTKGERLIVLNAKLLMIPKINEFLLSFYKQKELNKDKTLVAPYLLVTCFSHQTKELPIISPVFQMNIFQPITPSKVLNSLYRLMNKKELMNEKNNQNKPSPSADKSMSVEQFSGHILLAEDNKINQLVASKMLKSHGVNVTIANNGEEAVELIKSHDYDLVFMDIQMPVMDGIEATTMIRSIPKYSQLIIIAVTAHALDEEKQRCFDSGMNDHLSKPLIPQKLHEILSKWLT